MRLCNLVALLASTQLLSAEALRRLPRSPVNSASSDVSVAESMLAEVVADEEVFCAADASDARTCLPEAANRRRSCARSSSFREGCESSCSAEVGCTVKELTCEFVVLNGTRRNSAWRRSANYTCKCTKGYLLFGTATDCPMRGQRYYGVNAKVHGCSCDPEADVTQWMTSTPIPPTTSTTTETSTTWMGHLCHEAVRGAILRREAHWKQLAQPCQCAKNHDLLGADDACTKAGEFFSAEELQGKDCHCRDDDFETPAPTPTSTPEPTAIQPSSGPAPVSTPVPAAMPTPDPTPMSTPEPAATQPSSDATPVPTPVEA